jgi:hypothetical protein
MPQCKRCLLAIYYISFLKNKVNAPMQEMKELEKRLEGEADEGKLPKYPPKGM